MVVMWVVGVVVGVVLEVVPGRRGAEGRVQGLLHLTVPLGPQPAHRVHQAGRGDRRVSLPGTLPLLLHLDGLQPPPPGRLLQGALLLYTGGLFASATCSCSLHP